MREDPSRSPDEANGVAGRVVPVFAVTGGRTRSAGTDLPMESLVTVTEHAKQAENLRKEYRVILDIAERPVSLVEVGAALDVPVGVARVLVSDLAEANYLDGPRAPRHRRRRSSESGRADATFGRPPCQVTAGRSRSRSSWRVDSASARRRWCRPFPRSRRCSPRSP